MEIQKQSLLTALSTVRPGLASKDKGGLPQSTAFVFRDGRVQTYNDEVSVSCPVPELEELKGAVPAESLLGLLAKLPEDGELSLAVKEDGGEVLVQCGRIRAGLALQEEITLPLDQVSVGKKPRWQRLPEGFGEALRFTMYSCAKDLSLPILTCVHVRAEGLLEATDNFRVTSHLVPELTLKEDVLIPATSASLTNGQAFGEIFVGANGWVHFRDKETGTIFSCRTMAGEFPDLDKQAVLKVKGDPLTLPVSIGEMLDRVLVFSKRDFFLDERAEVTLTGKRLRIRAEGPDGWVEEEVNLRFKGRPCSFYVHPSFLRDMIPVTRSCIVGKDRLKFEGKNWSHVVALTEEAQ